jgi:uncharacterized protein
MLQDAIAKCTLSAPFLFHCEDGAQVLKDRPTLNSWLCEYDSIFEEYIATLKKRGITPEEPCCDQYDLKQLRARLIKKGASFRNGGASIVYGALSSACTACTGGTGSKTFMLSNACNRNCYFCFNANQENYSPINVINKNWQEELDAFLAKEDVTHVALTGGEPLLHKCETISFFKKVHSAFPDAHLRIYTDGDLLCEKTLEELQNVGLIELRLSVKLDVLDSVERQEQVMEEALARVTLAKKYVPDVMVEMPAIPGTKRAMEKLLLGLDSAGAFGINMLEFGYPMNDWGEFKKRGFKIANPPFPVIYDYEYAAGLPISGSEKLCLELLEFAIDNKLSLGVHYCSLENKHRDQILQQNRQAHLDKKIWTLDMEDFFYKTVKVFDCDTEPVKEKLNAAGATYEEDVNGNSISFSVNHLPVVSDLSVVFLISYNVIESKEHGLVVREVKLEPICDAGLLQRAVVTRGDKQLHDSDTALDTSVKNTTDKPLGEKYMDIWQLKASACELLAFSLRYPNDDLVQVISSTEWAEAALEITAALDAKLPENFSYNASACAKIEQDKLIHELRAEATRLFIGAPEPVCSPFEGVWRAKDDGVNPLLFVNPHSMDVEHFCKSCGLGNPEGTNEPLDSAQAELELLQYLASLAAGIIDRPDDAPANNTLPGGSVQVAYEMFLHDHALKWMPQFAEELCKNARHPFYIATGSLLNSLLKVL